VDKPRNGGLAIGAVITDARLNIDNSMIV